MYISIYSQNCMNSITACKSRVVTQLPSRKQMTRVTLNLTILLTQELINNTCSCLLDASKPLDVRSMLGIFSFYYLPRRYSRSASLLDGTLPLLLDYKRFILGQGTYDKQVVVLNYVGYSFCEDHMCCTHSFYQALQRN